MTCHTGRALEAFLEAEIADAGSAIKALEARRARLSAALAALRDDPDFLAGNGISVTVGDPEPAEPAGRASPAQARMLAWARLREGWFTAREAADHFGTRRTSAAAILQKLVAAGSVVTNGARPRSRHYAYRAIPAREPAAIAAPVLEPPAPPRDATASPGAPDSPEDAEPAGGLVDRPEGSRRPQAETEAFIRDFARELDGEWFRKLDLAHALGYSTANAVAPALNALIARGTIVTNGTPPRSPARRYRFAGRPEPASNGTNGHKGERAPGWKATGVAGTGRERIASTAKDYAAVIARARARGWRVEPGKGGHDLLVHRNGSRVSLSRSPSSSSAATALDADLRRKEREPQTART